MCIFREGHLVMLINTFETKPEQRSLIGAWLRFVWIVQSDCPCGDLPLPAVWESRRLKRQAKEGDDDSI